LKLQSLDFEMRLLFLFVLFLCLGSQLSVPARAGPAVDPMSAPAMTFQIVDGRWGGCGWRCVRWVNAVGRIEPNSAVKLRKVLDAAGNEPPFAVIIHSNGGSVDGAMALGALVRAQRLDTIVAQVNAMGQTAPGACLSACPLFFAGGVNRSAPEEARIGVHRVTTVLTIRTLHRRFIERRRGMGGELVSRELVSESVSTRTEKVERAMPATERKMRAHLAAMGVSDEIFPLMNATPAKDMRILLRSEIDHMHLATDFSSALDILDPVHLIKRPRPGVTETVH
jgi:hypothetical protein